MAGLFKKKWIKWLILAVIIGGAGAWYFLRPADAPDYVLEEAVKGNIVQTVSVTGSIKAAPTIDLNFQKNGTVEDIFVDEGERVEAGKVLAALENRALSLEVKRNKANVAYATAQYNQIKGGTRSEEVRIAEADVASSRASFDATVSEQTNVKVIGESNVELAQIALKQAEDNLAAAEQELETTTLLAENEIAKLELGGDNTQTLALESAYLRARTNLDLIIAAMQDSMFMVEEIIGVRGTGFFLLSQSTKNQLERNYYFPAEANYEEVMTAFELLKTDDSDENIEDAVNASIRAANSILALLTQTGTELQALPYDRDDLQTLIMNITSQTTVLTNAILILQEVQSTILNIKMSAGQDTETLILNYKLQIDAVESRYLTARNSMERAEFDVEQSKINADNNNRNADAQVAIRQAAVDSAEAMLNLKRSPVREIDLAPFSAQIALANVALEMANNEYMDSQLVAPIDGLVTFINGKVGQNVSLSETALKSFLTMQSDNLIVEANVPETDVSKIKPGDKVEMTIDAFDFTEKFQGKVVYIDPAETIIQGVVYYQLKTIFELKDERLKSGMTSNLNIITAEKEDVLIIPTRAIKYEDSIRYVDVLNNGVPKKTIITTGLESDQYVEVTSGLREGDKIITFVK